MARARVEVRPMGPRRVTEVQVNGRWLRPGVEFSVRGQRGRFRFHEAAVDDAGTILWLSAYGGSIDPSGYRAWRSFHPKGITVHSKAKLKARPGGRRG